MRIRGRTVDLTTAIGSDFDYVFEMCDKQATHRCLKELLPEMAREHLFAAFIVTDKRGKRLGVVHSNYLNEIDGYTVDLYVEDNCASYIPESFELFAWFMAGFTDRLYGYIHKDDQKIHRLSEIFGFQPVGEDEDFVITMREI